MSVLLDSKYCGSRGQPFCTGCTFSLTLVSVLSCHKPDACFPTLFNTVFYGKGNMDNSRVRALPPTPPEEDIREGKVYGNVLAELETVDLPLGTTLRYSEFDYFLHS